MPVCPASTCINVNINVLLKFLKDLYPVKQIDKKLTEDIFCVLCEKCNLSLNLTSRLHRQIRVKLTRLLLKLDKSKCGGRQLFVFEKWLIKNKCWSFKVLNSEFKPEPVSIQKRKGNIHQRKRLTADNSAAKQILKKYKSQSSTRALATYSRSHQYRLKSKLSDQCAQALEFLDFCGLEADTLTLKNKQSGKFQN